MLQISNVEAKAKKAVYEFWGARISAAENQVLRGNKDKGGRGEVTNGKNMDGFIELIKEIVSQNGLTDADIHLTKKVLTIPGFFRPTKQWDLLVMYRGELIAAIELKSQVGPSFGNNFNNRAEEVIGTAFDFWKAFKNGAFGDQPMPFVGWLMLVEDVAESRSVVRSDAPHFHVLSEFQNTSYISRYDLLCKKLVQEKLYTAAALMTSVRNTDSFGSESNLTSLKTFASLFAGHIAASAQRLRF